MEPLNLGRFPGLCSAEYGINASELTGLSGSFLGGVIASLSFGITLGKPEARQEGILCQ